MNTATQILTASGAVDTVIGDVADLIEDAADNFLSAGQEVDLQDAAYTCAGSVTLAGKGRGAAQMRAHNVLQAHGSGRFDGRSPEVQAERFMFMNFVALAIRS